MPLVPAKCPECGGNVVVDSEKEAWICDFCKTPFVVEKAINNFKIINNITNKNEIQADIVNVYEGTDKLDNLYERAKIYINEKNYAKAQEYLNRVLDIDINYEDAQNLSDMLPILSTVDAFEMILEKYYLVLEGKRSDFRLAERFSNCMEPLQDLCQRVCIYDKKKGEAMQMQMMDFIESLNKFIVNGDENDINNIPSLIVASYKQISMFERDTRITRERLIYDFIMRNNIEPYREKILEIYKIIKTEMDAFCGGVFPGSFHGGCKLWGHYFCSYSNYDGTDYYIGRCKESFTSADEVKKYIQEAKNNYLNDCKEKNICYKCKMKLSRFGKCKNHRCANYDSRIY